MSTSRSRLAPAVAALTLAATLALARPAAAEAGMAVTVVVDRSQVVLDLDEHGRPLSPVSLTYDVVVENLGAGLVPGVVATLELPEGLTRPGGRRPRFEVGDLGARGLWRTVVTGSVDTRPRVPTRLVAVATAAADDGTAAVSAPATTDVVAISAVTIERSEPHRAVSMPKRARVKASAWRGRR